MGRSALRVPPKRGLSAKPTSEGTAGPEPRQTPGIALSPAPQLTVTRYGGRFCVRSSRVFRGQTVDLGIAAVKTGLRSLARAMAGDGLIHLQGLAEMYWNLYKRPRAAWTDELVIGTRKENF